MGLGGDPNAVLRATGAAAYSDLPGGGGTVIAFTLAQRPNSGFKTTGNSITGNTFAS